LLKSFIDLKNHRASHPFAIQISQLARHQLSSLFSAIGDVPQSKKCRTRDSSWMNRHSLRRAAMKSLAWKEQNKSFSNLCSTVADLGMNIGFTPMSDSRVLFPPHSRSLRPSERVLRFFREKLQPAHEMSGERLPTIKEVSKHLDVSISTVQTVFATLSDAGQLKMIPGRAPF